MFQRQGATRPTGASIKGPCLIALSLLVLGATVDPSLSDIPTQQFVHESWTVNDGLPVNGTTDLLQSSDGYIWLATFDGLVRFDGVRFTVFNIANSPGLPSNRIVEIHEARGNELWLLTDQGHVAHMRDGQFKSWGPHEAVDSWVARYIHVGHDASVWVATDQGLMHAKDGDLVPFAPDLLPDGGAGATHLSRDGVLWVNSVGAILRVTDEQFESTPIGDLPSGGGALDFLELEDGTIWIVTTRGVDRYRDGEFVSVLKQTYFGSASLYAAPGETAVWLTGSMTCGVFRGDDFTEFDIPQNTASIVGAIHHDAQGRVCFAVGNTVFQDGKPVYTLPFAATRDAGVAAILHDHEGSVWFATRRDGLHRIKPSTFLTIGEPEGLGYDNVYPILEDSKGRVWIGSWSGGLDRIEDGRVTQMLSSGFYMSLYEDRSGRIWHGSINSIAYFDDEDKRTKLPAVDQDYYPDVSAAYQDRHGRMWFGAETGLFRYDDPGWSKFDAGDGVPPGIVRMIDELSDGGLWMATSAGGVMRFRDGRFDRLYAENGLSSNLVRSFYEDDDGVLWVGTEGKGLCRVTNWHGDLTAAEITVYREAHGLFDDGISQLLEDDYGRLWMSSNRGISWVTLEQLNAFARGEVDRVTATSYTERDGMRSRETNGGMSPAGIKASDGRLWFPTQKGVVVVDPATIARNTIPPPVVIENTRVAGERVRATDGAVRLSADQRDLDIEYTALSFMAPENMRFKYKLEGYNEEWVDVGARRVAYYTNVPAGDYRFRVIASNNNGVWNEAGADVAITIAPHFYETAWFFILVGLMLAGAGVGGYKYRTRRLKVRAEQLAGMVAERTRELRAALATVEAQADKLKTLDEAKSHFFANISHEFRTPLTLTIGPLEDLVSGSRGAFEDDTVEELDLALRNARRLLRLVNQILDVSKLEAGQLALHAQPGDIVAFCKGVSLAFVPLAERRGVHFDFDAPDAPIACYYDPDLLEKVLTNLLSNAFKFTETNGHVRLQVETDAKAVKLTVQDDGPGIPANELPHIFERFYQASESQLQASTGIGLSLARELVELHGGTIDVHSAEGEGAAFDVKLLLGTDHLRQDQIVDAGDTEAERRLAPVDADPEAPSLPVPATRASGEADEPTVLIVDDNVEIRDYVRGILESAYRVIEAVDGRDGLRVAREALPDVIVSDVMMPNMDGYALCSALKSDPDLDFIPLILLTAKATTDEKIAGLEKGADDYLTKPFDRSELVARVANLVASRRKLRERLAAARPAVHASEVDVTSSDDVFLEQMRSVIEAEMMDEDLTVDRVAEQLTMSRGHLHRRLRDLLGETPTDVIRRIRLERAAQLLAGRSGSVSEIAYAVGFKSLSHFSKCFRDQHGMTPSAYAKDATRTSS